MHNDFSGKTKIWIKVILQWHFISSHNKNKNFKNEIERHAVLTLNILSVTCSMCQYIQVPASIFFCQDRWGNRFDLISSSLNPFSSNDDTSCSFICMLSGQFSACRARPHTVYTSFCLSWCMMAIIFYVVFLYIYTSSSMPVQLKCVAGLSSEEEGSNRLSRLPGFKICCIVFCGGSAAGFCRGWWRWLLPDRALRAEELLGRSWMPLLAFKLALWICELL